MTDAVSILIYIKNKIWIPGVLQLFPEHYKNININKIIININIIFY